MLFQEEKQGNSRCCGLAEPDSDGDDNSEDAAEDAKEAFVWDAGFPGRKTVF